MRASSREELAQALDREYGEVQGRLAYAHLEALFAPPAGSGGKEIRPPAPQPDRESRGKSRRAGGRTRSGRGRSSTGAAGSRSQTPYAPGRTPPQKSGGTLCVLNCLKEKTRPEDRDVFFLRFAVHSVHVGHEIQDLVGVAPLVVVPGDQLDEVVVQHDARRLVKDAGLGKARQV